MLIQNNEQLEAACNQMLQSPHIALDIEFVRENTYKPTLSTIQFSNGDATYLIDYLQTELNYTKFKELLLSKDVTKVLHAAKQDIEIINQNLGIIPTAVFDTQIAAMFCGYEDIISYADLVFSIFGIKLDKSLQYSDWLKRPLKDKQIEYIKNDVIYLARCFPVINEFLKQNKRQEWVAQEMQAIADSKYYSQDISLSWCKIDFSSNSLEHFYRIKALAEFREDLAIKYNSPRQQVMKDSCIIELADINPKGFEALHKVKNLPNSFSKGANARKLLNIIASSVNQTSDVIPPIKDFSVIHKGYVAIIDCLKILLKLVSLQHGISSRIIATTKDLTAFACTNDSEVAFLNGWRNDIFGKLACKLKQGEIAMKINNKGLVSFVYSNGQLIAEESEKTQVYDGKTLSIKRA